MPTTHHFTPTHYHNTMGNHEPVLHLAPGDSIEVAEVKDLVLTVRRRR